ncbi:hypothetical protein PI125_g26728 [Phytophthora idaei]|nr:hypothetical protein PI125_g26728 [Phytophthora idaei]
MSWMRFAKDLYDGRIEQICILSDLERVKSEAEELRQLHAASTTESEDTLSAKAKKERFYDVLREHKDVLPDEIPAELPQDKGIQHEIDLVPGTKYCVTRQWPLPRDQVKAVDDFFKSRRQAGQVQESKSPQQCINVLRQEATGRMAHRSCLQQAERCDDTGADADTTKRCDHRFDGQEHHLQCS